MDRGTRALASLLLFVSTSAMAGVTGSIVGTVSDPTGAVVMGATVTAINTETKMEWQVITDQKGLYSFLVLPVGTYTVSVRGSGFEEFQQIGIAVDANSAIRLGVNLQIGDVHEQVLVSSTPVSVETTNTQMGEVIGSSKNAVRSPQWSQLHRLVSSPTWSRARNLRRVLTHLAIRFIGRRQPFGQRPT